MAPLRASANSDYLPHDLPVREGFAICVSPPVLLFRHGFLSHRVKPELPVQRQASAARLFFGLSYMAASIPHFVSFEMRAGHTL